MEGLNSVLSNLSLTDNKERVLGEIKPALSSLSREELSSELRNVDLIGLFDCLNTDKPSQIEVCCDILQYLLNYMDPAIVIEKYSGLMTRGLAHKNPKVVILILKQLDRCARDDELAIMIGNHAIFQSVLELLRGDLIVASEVSAFLLLVSEAKSGLEIFTRKSIVSKLQELMSNDDIVRVRVLELVVKISQISQEHLDILERVGLLHQLITIINVKDVLVRLTAVQLIADLALTHQGLRFLESKSVLFKMEEILREANADPFADVLIPGLVKFFGNIAHLRPKQMIVQHPNFVDSLFQLTESDNFVHKAVAFETLGYIGSSLEGKTALADLGNKMTNCIEKFERLIQDSSVEIRIRGLNAFANLIKLDKEHQTDEFLSITESWYRQALGRGSTSVIYGIVRQPFPDLRSACYLVLINMAKQSWGRKEILRFPGFPEMLLDRLSDRDKLGKEEKYELIRCLVENGDSAEIVGHELDLLLHDYVRQGPFYVPVQYDVAFEGGN